MDLKIRLNNKLFISTYIILLSVLLFTRDVFSIPISKFIYLFICSIYLFCADETTKISMISFLLPLMCGLPGTYILVVIMLLFIMKNRIKPLTVLLCLTFIVLELHSLSYIDKPFDNFVVSQLLFISVFFALLYTVEKVDYRQCLKMYLYGTILLSVVIDVYSLMNAPSDWLAYFERGWYRFGYIGEAESNNVTLRLNPISLGYFCTSGFLICVVLAYKSTRSEKILAYSGIIILTVTALLAVSRSFIFVVIGCMALIVFRYTKNAKHWLKLLVLIVFLVVVGIEIYTLFPQILSGMITRLSDSTMAGGGGRIALMIEYTNALFSDIRIALTGGGATHTTYALGASMSVHNAIMQILASYGIIGGTIFIVGMFLPLLRTKKDGYAEFIYWIPFIGIFVYMQTIQFLNPCFHMMAYIIAIFAVKEGRRVNSGHLSVILR